MQYRTNTINGIFFNIQSFFSKGHARSIKAKKNIAASFVTKGLNVFIGLLLVPMAINYVNPTQYGIWLTLSSIIGWFNLFDLGLGNGLRIKLSEAMAVNDVKQARIYISTTYFILTLMMLGIYILFIFINPVLNWALILNADSSLTEELKLLTFYLITFFAVRLVVDLVKTILIADQKIALNGFIGLISNIISLFAVIVLTHTTSGSLLYLGISYSAIPLIIGLIASLILYIKKYKQYRPSVKYINLSKTKDLANLGLKFFFIQITAIIIFSSDNIIITQVLNPLEVTKYNIAQKYFSIILAFYVVVLVPFVPAYAEAYFKNELEWIKSIVRKSQKFWLLSVGIVLIMMVFSNSFYKIWIGEEIQISILLSFFMGLNVIINMWSSIYAPLINGIGKISLSLYLSGFSIILNIPLSIYFAKNLGLGSVGVILATIFCVGLVSIFTCIQFYKIINNSSAGIWNR
ncbi:MAG: polysaccharide biosynthesis protein [Calditrichaeota bacterium]|nr:MAG: polysaccharide biosynthesis protein [Calditrichota bacterium]